MTDPTPNYYAQPAPNPYAPPPYNPDTKTNGFAIASLITSLLLLSIVGVILGHVALAQIKRRGEQGAVLATIGLIVGYLGCLGWLVFWGLIAFVFGLGFSGSTY